MFLCKNCRRLFYLSILSRLICLHGSTPTALTNLCTHVVIFPRASILCSASCRFSKRNSSNVFPPESSSKTTSSIYLHFVSDIRACAESEPEPRFRDFVGHARKTSKSLGTRFPTECRQCSVRDVFRVSLLGVSGGSPSDTT